MFTYVFLLGEYGERVDFPGSLTVSFGVKGFGIFSVEMNHHFTVEKISDLNSICIYASGNPFKFVDTAGKWELCPSRGGNDNRTSFGRLHISDGAGFVFVALDATIHVRNIQTPSMTVQFQFKGRKGMLVIDDMPEGSHWGMSLICSRDVEPMSATDKYVPKLEMAMGSSLDPTWSPATHLLYPDALLVRQDATFLKYSVSAQREILERNALECQNADCASCKRRAAAVDRAPARAPAPAPASEPVPVPVPAPAPAPVPAEIMPDGTCSFSLLREICESPPDDEEVCRPAKVLRVGAKRACSNCWLRESDDVGTLGGPPKFQVCSGCRDAAYCSRACQRAHWGAHKSTCQMP